MTSDRKPGDESSPDSAQMGENVCPDCGGTGRLDAAPCPACDGTGRILAIVGDA